MPTLPGRATSILAVLGGFSPLGRRALPTFDWPHLVEEARPGQTTANQREQANRLAKVQEDLARWVQEQSLPADHVEESAFYASVTLPPGLTHAWVVAVAKTICWIYAIDDFIDKQDLRPLTQAERKIALAHLDRDLGAILQPLASYAGRDLHKHRLTVQPGGVGRADTLSATAIRGSLQSLFTDLRAAWERLPSRWRRGRFRLRTAAEQVIACVAMMRQELHWNVVLTERPSAPDLPPFDAYLRCGAISIGMPAVAGVVAGFETHPRRAWRAGFTAIHAAGRVVRLTNDLHTFEADIEEGKVTAVILRLRELGWPSAGLDLLTSPQVRSAQTVVAADLARAVESFARHSHDAPAGLLRYYLCHSTAFALAVYGDGSGFSAVPRETAS